MAGDEESLDALWLEAQRVVRHRIRHALQDQIPGAVGGGGLRILGHVVLAGALSPADLVHRFDIRSSTITAHLDRLEAAGWLRRDPSPGTPSRIQVTATDAGRDTYARSLAIRRAVVERFLEPLAESERESLRRMLAVVLEPARSGVRHGRPGGH